MLSMQSYLRVQEIMRIMKIVLWRIIIIYCSF